MTEDINLEKEIERMTMRLKRLDDPNRQKGESTGRKSKAQGQTLDDHKKENKELKQTLAKLLRDQGRKGKSFQQAELEKLETKVHQLRLTHDDLKHRTSIVMKHIRGKQDNLRDIRKESKPIADDSPVTRQIRMLENRLDKAMIKYNEAQSIKKTYQAILKRLQAERIGFDNQLQAIERTLKAKDHDYQELRNMYHEAKYLKELAKSELLEANQEFKEMQRQKEKELGEKKKFVQVRIDITSKITKREANRRKIELEGKGHLDVEGEKKLKTASFAQIFQGATNDSKIAQEHEKLTKLEKKWRQIKEVTGVNDANEVIQKYLSSTDTHNNLQQMTKEAQEKIEQLTSKKQQLKDKLEDIKYSQSSGVGSRRVVDDYVQQLTESTNQADRNRQQYERVAKILINIKAGIEHLAEKLRPLDETSAPVTKPTPNQPEGEYITSLVDECQTRLTSLMEKVDPELANADEEEDLDAQFTLSKNNIRIHLEEDDEEEDSDDEQETDVLDRQQLKKLSYLAIEKGKKKKGKASNSRNQ